MLFGLSSNCRYHLYAAPADMRKGFDGLSGLVSNELGRDPLSGDVFVFVNRRRTLVKLLCWDRGGFVLYHKRLEQGTFELPPVRAGEASVPLSREVLLMVLEGISLAGARRERYAGRKVPSPT